MRNLKYFILAYFLHAPAVSCLLLLLTLQSCGQLPDHSGSNLVCWGMSPLPCHSCQALMPRAGPLPLPLLLRTFSCTYSSSEPDARLLPHLPCLGRQPGPCFPMLGRPLLLLHHSVDASRLTQTLELPILTF